MTFSPEDLQQHLTNYYGFQLILKKSGKPHNKKVHRLNHPSLDFTLHIQDEDYSKANIALPYIDKYVATIPDCIAINGVIDPRESNRSCFIGYPDKDLKHATSQKQALCFTIENKDAVAPLMELLFDLKAI